MECQAIYGRAYYGKAHYGDPHCLVNTPRYSYDGIPLGLWVRKQLAKTVIFRVQPGNGYYESKVGELYQHRYDYFVPASITHANGDASRACLAAAVLAWQNLTEEQQKVYNRKASRHYRFSGYNLFIKDYMKLNYTP